MDLKIKQRAIESQLTGTELFSLSHYSQYWTHSKEKEKKESKNNKRAGNEDLPVKLFCWDYYRET